MSNGMSFPDTVEEYMNQYKMTDTDKVYSNGTEYVPIFRMKQWFDHVEEQKYDEWCTGCKEYDPKRHCCPRWNRVIRETVEEMKHEKGGEE